ncbi:MAG: MarR family winged helix-turn-helix transcriptional regulator [Parvibaculaceae bacterium]
MVANRSLRREFLSTLIETSRHLRHFVDRRAQRLGLTGAQLRLLSKLRRKEGATQAELASAMEMRPISLSGLVDKLAQQGLVERRADQNDRRLNRLYLTPGGRELAWKIDGFREEVAQDVLRNVDEATLDAALDVLHGLKRQVKAQQNEVPIAAE